MVLFRLCLPWCTSLYLARTLKLVVENVPVPLLRLGEWALWELEQGWLILLEFCYVSLSAPPGKDCTGLSFVENCQCLLMKVKKILSRMHTPNSGRKTNKHPHTRKLHQTNKQKIEYPEETGMVLYVNVWHQLLKKIDCVREFQEYFQSLELCLKLTLFQPKPAQDPSWKCVYLLMFM